MKPSIQSFLIPLFLFFLYPGIAADLYAQAPKEEKSVEVNSVRTNDTFHLNATNKNPYSITLTIEVMGDNFKLNTRQPVTKIIEPNSTKHLLSVFADDKEKNFKFNTSYKWIMGNTRAHHDDSYVYSLPFSKGKSYRVGQSYDGDFSHNGNIRYSVDFMMPLKSQIRAARSGYVVQLKEDSNRGGTAETFKNESNFVVIEHEDGTFAEYAHLSENGVLVNLGQKVYEGQIIGLSGNTGYSSGPHLHFMVLKVKEDGTNESLPVRFKTKTGILEQLVEGQFYMAR